jgi:hypothetical protein
MPSWHPLGLAMDRGVGSGESFGDRDEPVEEGTTLLANIAPIVKESPIKQLSQNGLVTQVLHSIGIAILRSTTKSRCGPLIQTGQSV